MIIPSNPSFAERARSLLRQVLAMGQTRLEMLGLAVEQEVAALGRELRLAALCIISAWLAGTSLVLWIAVMFPRQVGLWILGVAVHLFAFTSLMSWQILKTHIDTGASVHAPDGAAAPGCEGTGSIHRNRP
ncbi:MAG: hypothetical protein WDM77_17365 [Steroidobacteraceae bacterium]